MLIIFIFLAFLVARTFGRASSPLSAQSKLWGLLQEVFADRSAREKIFH